MKINRQKFLDTLNMVKAGLSPREFIEQSSCFCFQEKSVMTFNDEIACRKEIEINITGAVQAASLLAILEKMDDPELIVLENEKGELEFQGKRKQFGVTKDAEVFLPIERVERPAKWRTLPKDFIEAIKLVKHCVSTDESRFLLTCIHLAPDFIEACDNYQVMRHEVDTGLSESVLVRGTSLSQMAELGMQEGAMTKSWMHFRNEQELIFSCRRYAEDYPSLEKILSFKGSPIVIPKGLKDASERAAVFAMDKAGDPLVTVKIRDRKMRILGEGLSGWYKEVKKINYEGPPMEFYIAPELLMHISETYSEAEISQDKLKATGGKWTYTTVLGRKKDEEEEQPRKKKSEEDEEE